MMTALRNRMGRLGVLMTLLALLFAVSPVLEAAACASEGCGVACQDQASAPTDQTDPASGDCADDGCLCAVGHCGQSAGIPAFVEVSVTPISIAASQPIRNEPLNSAFLQTLDRPPRF
jgi:hypothetical protein